MDWDDYIKSFIIGAIVGLLIIVAIKAAGG